jgi:iron complex outermembrane receptor protein
MSTAYSREIFAPLAAALIGASTLISVATAAEGGGSSLLVLEEIVVTANKRDERIEKVPSSVTVVGEKLIERVQAANLSDVAAYVPGLTVRPVNGRQRPESFGGRVRGRRVVWFEQRIRAGRALQS